jgi:hypothetical protein
MTGQSAASDHKEIGRVFLKYEAFRNDAADLSGSSGHETYRVRGSRRIHVNMEIPLDEVRELTSPPGVEDVGHGFCLVIAAS